MFEKECPIYQVVAHGVDEGDGAAGVGDGLLHVEQILGNARARGVLGLLQLLGE